MPNPEDHPLRLLDRVNSGGKISRRQFLAITGAVAAGEIVASQLGAFRRVFASGTAGGSADGIVVVIYMGGGNDGLNTVIPWSPTEYAKYVELRPSLAYPAPGTPGRTDTLIPISSAVALNPAFTNVSQWYGAGKVAIVQGIGYGNPNLSHFESHDHWEYGFGAAGSRLTDPRTGWVGRWAEQTGAGPLGAISMTWGGLPLSLRGSSRNGVNITPSPDSSLLGLGQNANVETESALRAMAGTQGLGALAQEWSNTAARALDLAPSVNSAFANWNLPTNATYLFRQLFMASNFINAQVGTRVLFCEYGGFDTHENQRSDSRGADWHRNLHTDLDTSLNMFFSRLSAGLRRRVTVVTYSEFGRRPAENGTAGTDHGTASSSFVIGDNVAGGLYGEYPSLFDLDADENLRATVDFRQLWSTLLERWLGTPAVSVVGAQHTQLPLFAAAPGDIPGSTSTSTSTSSSTSTSTTSFTTTSSTSSSTTVAPTSTTSASTTLAPTTLAATTLAPTSIATTSTTVAPNPTSTTVVVTTVTTPASTVPESTVPGATTTTSGPTTTSTTTSTTTLSPSTVAPTTEPTTTVEAVTTALVTTTTLRLLDTTTTAPTTSTTLAASVATTSPDTSSTTSTTRASTTTVAVTRPVPEPPRSTGGGGNPDAVNNVIIPPRPTAPPPPAPPVQGNEAPVKPTPFDPTTTVAQGAPANPAANPAAGATTTPPATTKGAPESVTWITPISVGPAPNGKKQPNSLALNPAKRKAKAKAKRRRRARSSAK